MRKYKRNCFFLVMKEAQCLLSSPSSPLHDKHFFQHTLEDGKPTGSAMLKCEVVSCPVLWIVWGRSTEGVMFQRVK